MIFFLLLKTILNLKVIVQILNHGDGALARQAFVKKLSNRQNKRIKKLDQVYSNKLKNHQKIPYPSFTKMGDQDNNEYKMQKQSKYGIHHISYQIFTNLQPIWSLRKYTHRHGSGRPNHSTNPRNSRLLLPPRVNKLSCPQFNSDNSQGF